MRPVVVLAVLVALAGCAPAAAPASGPAPAYRVLVFSRTAGFRHDSIPAGIRAVRDLGTAGGFAVDATEDARRFTAANLARYRVVVFLSTTGDVLDARQQDAFEGWIRAGGGFVGVHSATDTEYGWPFYGELVGAYFAGHPAVQPATIRVEDRTHPSTAHLGTTWTRTDEWYNFRTDPRATAHVLLALDEASYRGGTMGTDHPVAWCKRYAGGRSFYTAGGHPVEAYAEPAFRAHLLGGIRWAAGVAPGSCDAGGPTLRATPPVGAAPAGAGPANGTGPAAEPASPPPPSR